MNATKAARDLSALASLPVPVYKHTPFFICSTVLAAVVQLSACAKAASGPYLSPHRAQIVQTMAVLKTLGTVWPVAHHVLSQVRAVTNEVMSGNTGCDTDFDSVSGSDAGVESSYDGAGSSYDNEESSYGSALATPSSSSFQTGAGAMAAWGNEQGADAQESGAATPRCDQMMGGAGDGEMMSYPNQYPNGLGYHHAGSANGREIMQQPMWDAGGLSFDLGQHTFSEG